MVLRKVWANPHGHMGLLITELTPSSAVDRIEATLDFISKRQEQIQSTIGYEHKTISSSLPITHSQ